MEKIEGIKGIGNRSVNMENHLPSPQIERENGCLKVAE